VRVSRLIAFTVAAVTALGLASASLAQAACTTANPAANISGFTEPLAFQPGEALPEFSDAQIEANPRALSSRAAATA
jgi:hypothetical protein